MRLPSIIGLVLIGLAAAAPAAAQTRQEQWDRCGDKVDKYPIDVQIAGCTALITSGTETPHDLSVAYMDRGITYNRKKDYTRALADYDEALRHDPAAQTANIHHGRGDAYFNLGRYREAASAYDMSLPSGADRADWLADRGDAYLRQGENFYPSARTDYDKAIRLDPANIDALTGLGSLALLGKDYAAALVTFERAIAVKGGDADLFTMRARAHAMLHHNPEALADYDRSVALSPTARRKNIACWQIAVYVGTGLDRARALCDEALREAPDNADFHDSRGMVGLKQRRYQDAWSDYDAAAKADPTQAGYFYGRAIAALRLGRPAESQADIARAKAITPGIAEVFAGWGVAP
jgi:tetratricopeptide (TPR) repeat protein